MVTYKKVSDEVYEKVSDTGSNTFKLEDVSITAILSDVRRISSGGTERDIALFKKEEQKEPELKYERYINALWKPEDYHFEVFNEEGDHNFRRPVYINIKAGDFKYSRVQHFSDKYSPEALYFSFYLSDDWFDWLWKEIGERPHDPVTVKFATFLWLMGIEASMYYEVHYNPVRVHEDSAVPIKAAKFHVGKLEPEMEPPAEAPATLTEKLERELETTDAGIWAKRIFWVLVVIAAIIYFRGH